MNAAEILSTPVPVLSVHLLQESWRERKGGREGLPKRGLLDQEVGIR